MKVTVLSFGVPKAGNAEDEYEDAVAVSRPGSGGVACRVAVGDGATGSSFSGLWARLLCESFVAGEASDSLEDRLPDLGRRWKADVERLPLPWYAAEKARSGAFAALLGLTLREEGMWQAVAVGDCCLFQVRGDSLLVTAFPMTRPDDFGSSPALIGTYPVDNRHLAEQRRSQEGDWRGGDVLYLMSDALAAWFLADAAGGGAPWRWFGGLKNGEHGRSGFQRIVADLRSGGRIANDDTTLVIVRISGEKG